MLNELLGMAKSAGFVIKELICDKDTSTRHPFASEILICTLEMNLK